MCQKSAVRNNHLNYLTFLPTQRAQNAGAVFSAILQASTQSLSQKSRCPVCTPLYLEEAPSPVDCFCNLVLVSVFHLILVLEFRALRFCSREDYAVFAQGGLAGSLISLPSAQ